MCERVRRARMFSRVMEDVSTQIQEEQIPNRMT